jgi:para-nitrobenzyl esterase
MIKEKQKNWFLLFMLAGFILILLAACSSSDSIIPRYKISGTITSGGAALSGVTVTLSGVSTGTTTTDATGAYTFTGLTIGVYTVAPTKTGYTFTPTSTIVTLTTADATGQNFTATTSLSGTVVDGYLVGAKVCLDKNSNRQCDAGEPFATSGTGGAFAITGVVAADVDQYPITVEATPATTTDEDTGAPVSASYILSAPNGHKDVNGKYVVTPLTSLMHQHIIDNPTKTNAEAETQIKTLLGAASGVSLAEDFVAKKTDAAYLKLYQLAQVITRTMTTMVNAQTDSTPDAVMKHVQDVIDGIKAVQADPVNFDTASGKITSGASDAIVAGTSVDSVIGLVRTTKFGKVQGKLSSTVSSHYWIGIPYAAPPVGSLRWQAPTDPAPWTTTLETKTYGKVCMQASILSTIANQDEDCLTLNIWSPASGETNLPVLVFVYGGSNIGGASSFPIYSGEKMASEQKVVFVTINYRVNLFGWFYHSAIQTGDQLGDSGNYGLLDIVQALKFVKNNIAKFGGDPNNVTLSGQSAGAFNTWCLLASPQAAGLFHKAVPLSGTLLVRTKAEGTTFGDKLLAMLVRKDGLAADNASAVAYIAANLSTDALKKTYLYNKTSAQLMAAYTGISGDSNNPSNYFVSDIGDGIVMPPDFDTAFTGNYLNNVPVMAGNTNEEGKQYGVYFSKSVSTLYDKWMEMLATSDPDNPTITSIDQIIQAAYLPADKAFTSCSDAGYNAITLNVNYPAISCANGKYNTAGYWAWQTTALNKYQPLQPKTYAYNFAWAQEPVPFNTVFGAAHIADVPFLFGNATRETGGGPSNWYNFTFGYSTANKPGRDALSLKMRQSLAAFMRTGDPNNASLGVTWLPWSITSGGAKRLVFDADYNNASITMSTSDTPIPR